MGRKLIISQLITMVIAAAVSTLTPWKMSTSMVNEKLQSSPVRPLG